MNLYKCFFHACPHYDCIYYIEKCKNDTNHLCNKTFRKLYKRTKKRIKKLKKMGYNVVTIQECQYLKQLDN